MNAFLLPRLGQCLLMAPGQRTQPAACDQRVRLSACGWRARLTVRGLDLRLATPAAQGTVIAFLLPRLGQCLLVAPGQRTQPASCCQRARQAVRGRRARLTVRGLDLRAAAPAQEAR